MCALFNPSHGLYMLAKWAVRSETQLSPPPLKAASVKEIQLSDRPAGPSVYSAHQTVRNLDLEELFSLIIYALINM